MCTTLVVAILKLLILLGVTFLVVGFSVLLVVSLCEFYESVKVILK